MSKVVLIFIEVMFKTTLNKSIDSAIEAYINWLQNNGVTPYKILPEVRFKLKYILKKENGILKLYNFKWPSLSSEIVNLLWQSDKVEDALVNAIVHNQINRNLIGWRLAPFTLYDKYCIKVGIYKCYFSEEKTIRSIQTLAKDRVNENIKNFYKEPEALFADWRITHYYDVGRLSDADAKPKYFNWLITNVVEVDAEERYSRSGLCKHCNGRGQTTTYISLGSQECGWCRGTGKEMHLERPIWVLDAYLYYEKK